MRRSSSASDCASDRHDAGRHLLAMLGDHAQRLRRPAPAARRRAPPPGRPLNGKRRRARARRRDRVDAVRLEQAADDARLDLGVRAEDDGPVHPITPMSHAVRAPARPRLMRSPPRRSTSVTASDVVDSQQDERHVVVRARSPANACTSRRMRSRSSSNGSVGVLLDERAQGGSRRTGPRPAFIASLMPVGEEHEQIAAVSGSVTSSSARGELLAVVELQAEHHAVGHQDPRAPAQARGRQVDERRVAGARVGHRARARCRARRRSS